MERYESPVRATLRRYGGGIGLDDVLRGDVSVDDCWAVLMEAPRNSPLWSAVYADPSFVPGTADREPSLAEYSPEVEALAAVHDEVQALRLTVGGMFGGSVPKLQPYRRPGEARREAAQAAEREVAQQEWDAIVSQLIPMPGGELVLPGGSRLC